MAEYIEREELINAMNNMCNRVCDYSHAQDYSPAQRYFVCKCCTLGSAFDLVEEFPAADVQPVKHGRWELAEDGWYCTACELYPPFDCDPEEKGIPYCPYCGAKMRGEDNG